MTFLKLSFFFCLFFYNSLSNIKNSLSIDEKITLYYTKGFSSFANRIIINELNIPANFKKINLILSNGSIDNFNYADVNPREPIVPLLRVSRNNYVIDAMAISLYLTEKYDKKGLLLNKNKVQERYKTLEIMNFFFSDIQTMNILLMHPKYNFSKESKVKLNSILSERMKYLNDYLINKNNEFIIGKRFTVADAFAFSCINFVKYMGFDLAKWPNVDKYYENMKNRPSISKSIKQEGL